jgi:hypothetical protein
VSSANKKANIDNRREKGKIVGVATFGVPNEEIGDCRDYNLTSFSNILLIIEDELGDINTIKFT